MGSADDDDVVCEYGRIVLTSVRPGPAEAARARLEAMGIGEADVVDAVNWARASHDA